MTVVALIGIAAKVSLALMVLAVGLAAHPRDATYLFRHWGLFIRSLLAMHVIMPLITLWAAVMFELDPVVKVALVALSVSPMPPFLPSKALRSGGNAAYITSLLTVVSVLSVVVIPASFGFLGALFDRSLSVPLGDIERILSIGILAPLGLGMIVRRVVPHAAERGAPLVSRVATIILLVVLLPILVSMWPDMRTLIGNGTLVAIIFLTLVGLLVGHVFGGPRHDHREVLALATCARHPAIAIAIVTLNFPTAPMVAPAVLLAIIVAAVTTLPYEHWMRRTLVPAPRRHRYTGAERRGRV